jgi:oligoribonuclease
MLSDDALVWVDMEMTGLDPQRDRVLEIATIVTDAALAVIAEGPVLAIHQDDATLAAMDEWNTRTHGASGLVERVRASRLDEREAVQDLTLEFLRPVTSPPGKSPMCGNSICQDRRFMAQPHAPPRGCSSTTAISTSAPIKELARRWRPDVLASRHQAGQRTVALDDIRDSIAELRHYRDTFFRIDH